MYFIQLLIQHMSCKMDLKKHQQQKVELNLFHLLWSLDLVDVVFLLWLAVFFGFRHVFGGWDEMVKLKPLEGSH